MTFDIYLFDRTLKMHYHKLVEVEDEYFNLFVLYLLEKGFSYSKCFNCCFPRLRYYQYSIREAPKITEFSTQCHPNCFVIVKEYTLFYLDICFRYFVGTMGTFFQELPTFKEGKTALLPRGHPKVSTFCKI